MKKVIAVVLTCCIYPIAVAWHNPLVNRNNARNGKALLSTISTTTRLASTSQPQQADQERREVSAGGIMANDEILKLKQQARQMRREAQRLDVALTTQKIETIRAKLSNEEWQNRHPDEATALKSELERLNDRLAGKESKVPIPSPNTFFTPPAPVTSGGTADSTKPSTTSSSSTKTMIAANDLSPSTKEQQRSRFPSNPISGFDDKDLEAYLPVAKRIDEEFVAIPNATIEQKLDAFRSAPELQDYFQTKIKAMLVEPLEEMQRLEGLKRDFLESTSSKEKETIKRKIEQLEQKVEDDGPFMYTDSVYCKDLPPLPEEEINERLVAIRALPSTLQAIYKQRCGLDKMDVGNETSEDYIRLAVEVDHFEPQLQLLEQVKHVTPITEGRRREFVLGYNSMPISVQEYFVEKQGITFENDVPASAEDVLDQLLDSTAGAEKQSWSSLMRTMEQTNNDMHTSEYNDIEFVDRSRFVEEFFPSIAKMEVESLPTLEDVEEFATTVLDKKAFMVSSKPERVVGGYYIRGRNLLEGEDAADQMVDRIKNRLDASTLASKLEFYYILDPAPPSDEDIELEVTTNPIILVTSKNPTMLYNPAGPTTKIAVSMLGIFSAFLFSVGSCALNPLLSGRFTDSLDAASNGTLDLQWLAGLSIPTFLSILTIQLAHELAHRAVARNKFEVGVPNFIPSAQFGLTGAITPLKSPPPNFKTLFDFAMAGPLVGLVVSFCFLVGGLSMTASMDPSIQLPVIPIDVLRSSSFVGGMTSFFLGKAALMAGQGPQAVLELHPFAIAGLVGCFTNALALLPLGHTDGGRISLTMFGRRGSFVVKLFTTLILIVSGILGFDNADIFLTYALFAMIWQRELETPVRNEVDELDFPRGLVGISTALLVALVLVPML